MVTLIAPVPFLENNNKSMLKLTELSKQAASDTYKVQSYVEKYK